MIKPFEELPLRELISASSLLSTFLTESRKSIYVAELGQGMDGFRYLCGDCRRVVYGKEGEEAEHAHDCRVPGVREVYLSMSIRIAPLQREDLETKAAQGDPEARRVLRFQRDRAEREAKKRATGGKSVAQGEGGEGG